MLFAQTGDIQFWVQAGRDYGALLILGFLCWQLQPLVKLLLDHNAKNAELDRAARHTANSTFQVAIAEAYQTMRIEGKENREAQERQTVRIVDAIKGACMFEQHRHNLAMEHKQT